MKINWTIFFENLKNAMRGVQERSFEYMVVEAVDEHGLVEYYAAVWEAVEDGIVDMLRDDVLAQLGFFVVDSLTGEMTVASHFTNITRDAFILLQCDNTCYIHVHPPEHELCSETYLEQLKALRKERRTRSKKKLCF
jgi:hypothetical protein